MGKVFEFTNAKERYLSLADKKVEKGDFVGGLSMLYSAYNLSGDKEIFGDIAELYADMELYELSNKFWFKYLDAMPKERSGAGYEALGINYFCLQNFFVSSYYFHKKVLTDGFISQDGLTEEMMEMFSDSFGKKKAYRIAYPFDKADYSIELNNAKRALVNGDYASAIRLYESVPEGSKQFKEASGELAVVHFITGDVDKAIEITKESIKKEGESTSLLCNLSSMYLQKKNQDKSAYYYNRAKEIFDGDKEGTYKLSTCALEQKDTKIALIYLEKVVGERPYEVNLNFLYALALANDNQFEKALEVIRKVYLIMPHDVVYKYYLELFSSVLAGENHDDLFPLEYVDDLPKAARNKRARRIDQIFSSDLSKLSQKLKDQKTLEILDWGLECASERTVKKCVYILTQADTDFAKDLLREKLLDPETADEVKRAIIFMLVLAGKTKKIPVVIKDFFMTIKPRELPCKKSPDGEIFYAGYALCLSRIIFGEASEFDKLAFATDKVYKKLKDMNLDEFDKETVASLILVESKLEKVPSVKDVLTLFGAKKDKFEKLRSMYKGEIDG